MKAIILGAGQGKRLLPLTENQPKALLLVSGRRLVEWQIEALAEAGVEEIVFVSGFNAPLVEKTLSTYRSASGSCRIRILNNPFYTVADNISSCWVARGEMTGDFVLMNGDTLLRAPLLNWLFSSPQAAVTLAVDKKPAYDEDDMKVRLDGTRLLDIGKKLPPQDHDAESIGCMLFRGDGPQVFAQYLDRLLREPENLKQFYLSVIRAMARDGVNVRVASIEGHPWCEIDYPLDLKRAQTMLLNWTDEIGEALEQTALGTS